MKVFHLYLNCEKKICMYHPKCEIYSKRATQFYEELMHLDIQINSMIFVNCRICWKKTAQTST